MLTICSGRGLAGARRQQGFNLVELMVSLVLGLIVSGAVIAFIAAILRANSETILSTRLTQELRSVNEVVSREVRRARYVEDSIALLNAANPYTIQISGDRECITFGYESVPAASGVAAVSEYRAIRRQVVGGVGQIAMSSGTAPQACADAVQPLVSTQFDIQTLEFESTNPDRVDVTISGKYRTGPYEDVVRTFRSSVFVRSGGI